MRCVRVFYTKTGPAKYISHLDLMRFMTRAVRRAQIPLWYTQGFNPHPYLTFALPLSLGMESAYEAMDLRIEGEMTDEELTQRLQTAMPQGIAVLRVCAPQRDPKEIARAAYTVCLTFMDVGTAQAFASHAQTRLNGAELIVMKRGKSGRKKIDKPVDLLPYLYACEISESESTVRLSLCLAAGGTVHINPTLLVDALTQEPEYKPYDLSIRRERLLTGDGQPWQ